MIVIALAAGIALLASAALIYSVAPGKMPPEAKKMSEAFYGLYCAHRGLYSEDQRVPENSLPAFDAARAAGYGVELDVQLSSDGYVVVFHDDDLKRVCGIDKPVNSLDWKSLSALTLFDSRERIPLFSEVLALLGDSPVIVELKPAGANNAALCQKMLDILRTQGRYWCVESFDPRIVAWFRKNAPDVLRGQLSDLPRKFNTQAKAMSFMLGNLLVNFISRPHFVAYSVDPRPLAVRLCMAMKPISVIWTVHADHDIAKYERENETMIFEHFTPVPRYRNDIRFIDHP